MSWSNFTDEESSDKIDKLADVDNIEPKKVIDSVSTLNTLNVRTKELSSQIMADIDKQTSLNKQIIKLDIDNLNTTVSKETTYKTEQELTDAFSDEILNHNNEDLFRNFNNYNISLERKKRYDLYDQMLDQNYISGNILTAYKDNILIRNAQTKTFLNVQIPTEKSKLMASLGNDLKNNYEKFATSCLLKYQLQKQLKDLLIPKTLTYGNYFIEIVDLNKLSTAKGGISRHEQILLENDSIVKRTPKNKEILFENELPYETQYKSESFDFVISTSTTNKDKTIIKESYTFSIDFESNFDTFDSEEELLTTLQENEQEKYRKNKVLEQLQENEANVSEENYLDNFIQDLILTENIGSEDYSFVNYLSGLDGISSSDFYGNINNPSNNRDYKLEDITKLNFDCLKDIHFEYIHPKDVVIIEKNNLIYGYLIIMDSKAGDLGSEVDTFKRFAQGLTSTSIQGSEKHENISSVNKIVDTITDEILKKVVHNIRLNKKRHLGTNYDYFKTLNINEDTEASLKLLIYNKIKSKSKLKFRFITPENIVNFSTNVDKFGPYGTSVLDSVVGPVKLYNLALMSSIVSRLSRASVIRKWTIEAGDKRNHKELVDSTTAEIKSKAITFDKINSLKNISEIITDFKDMATISIGGQKFIDMELLPMQDRGLPLNDLNDLKQDIVNAGKVPGIYLNIADNIDLREALVHLNINFANNIIDKQHKIEDGLDDTISNVFRKVLYYNNFNANSFILSNYVKLKLNPPLVLQLQADEAQIGVVSNIAQALGQLNFPVDPVKFLERYIPTIDWDTLQKEGAEYVRTLQKKTITDPNNQNGGGY